MCILIPYYSIDSSIDGSTNADNIFTDVSAVLEPSNQTMLLLLLLSSFLFLSFLLFSFYSNFW